MRNLREAMKRYGFAVHETGGNCTAYVRAAGGIEDWITERDQATHPRRFGSPVVLCTYPAGESEAISERQFPSLTACLAELTFGLTTMDGKRYQVSTLHGEGTTIYNVVDTWAPDEEQPSVLHSWSLRHEPNAQYLAVDFCQRHN